MARFSMEVDLKELEKMIDKTTEQINKGIEQGLKVCASEIKQMEQRQIENTTGGGSYVPTGRLKRSVTIMPIEWSPYSASITVMPTASYSRYVNEGTGIYHPQGRQGGWVYSPDGGATFIFTHGIFPHYFVQDTYEFYKDKAPIIIKNEIYKCIR